MILYFTGTGNSRFVAEMLADLTGDEAVSMNDCIKSGEKGSFHSEKPYVFVSPVYVSAIPRAVESFVDSAEFSGSKKAYFIMTCAGGMGGSPAYAQKLADRKGFEYMGTAQVEMPQNYLVFFTTKDRQTSDGIIEAAKPVVRGFAELIAAEKELPDPGMKSWEYISTEMILAMYYKWFMSDKPFTVSDACISCGKCEKLCPLNNIVLKDGKPTWGGNCTHCMACINSCPKQAIEYGKKSVGKYRYTCRKYKPEE